MPFALFVDMLGTSQAMTSLPDNHIFDRDIFSPRERLQRGLRYGAERAEQSLLLCATFSDCGYVITESALEMLHVIRTAMWHFKSNVPVRGGVGYGNFGLNGTNHHWNGKATFAEASFFGSSIVRAHRAESCGHKGFRVFVHCSAVDLLEAEHPHTLVFPEDIEICEEGIHPPPSPPGTVVEIPKSRYLDVAHEICCIGNDATKSWLESVDFVESEYRPSSESAIHYTETRNALLRFERLRKHG